LWEEKKEAKTLPTLNSNNTLGVSAGRHKSIIVAARRHFMGCKKTWTRTRVGAVRETQERSKSISLSNTLTPFTFLADRKK
jgi:hypothetical protein